MVFHGNLCSHQSLSLCSPETFSQGSSSHSRRNPNFCLTATHSRRDRCSFFENASDLRCGQHKLNNFVFFVLIIGRITKTNIVLKNSRNHASRSIGRSCYHSTERSIFLVDGQSETADPV